MLKKDDLIYNEKEALTFKEYIDNLIIDDYIFNYSYNGIFKFLREHDYIYYNDDKRNIPNKQYIDLGYFKMELSNNDKFYIIHILEKGKNFLKDLFLKNNIMTIPIGR